jgi:tungstate transport system substrate-binding protein
MKVLTDSFTGETKIPVEVLAVGTGQALALGRNGDVDLLLVHAPKAEKAFVREGFGVARIPLMFNDFVLLGPDDDPAGVFWQWYNILGFKAVK